jgi:membrane protein
MNRINQFLAFTDKFLKEFSKQSIFKESAALSFITLTSLIPFTMFLLFFIPELASFDAESVEAILVKVMLPSSAQQIVHIFKSSLGSNSTYNIMTFVGLFFTSVMLFFTINRAFDKVLYIDERKRGNFLVQIVQFIGMLILGFILTALIFSSSSIPIISKVFNIPILKIMGDLLLPFLLLFFIIIMSFFFIPSLQVRKRVIIVSGLLTTTTWIIVKSLFNYYIKYLTNLQIVYGVVASIPISMFWIYVNWIIILSGVVLISILENRSENQLPIGKRKKVLLTLEYSSEQNNILKQSSNEAKISKLINLIAQELSNEGESKN